MHKLAQWLTLMGLRTIWTSTNRYNAEINKKYYKTLLLVLFAIPYFCPGRKMINLLNKIKLFSEKQLND